MDKWVMEINDFNSIHEAKIEINKINVVGGVNGSGKSTVSRIFYSFLKANSIHRKDFILKRVINRINKLIKALNLKVDKYKLPKNLTINDDPSYIIHTLDIILEISKDYDNIAIIKKEEFLKKINGFKEKLSNDGIDITINENNIDNDYFRTHDFVDNLFKEYHLNLDYLNDYLELKKTWKKFQYYRSNFYGKCLNIYSEVEEFLIEDIPSVNEKIFNRLLLKEYVSPNSKDFDLKMIIDRINRTIDVMDLKTAIPPLPDYLIEEIKFDLPRQLTLDDNFSNVIKTLNTLLVTSKDFDKIAKLKKNEFKKELIGKFEEIIKILIEKNIDVSDIESALYSTNDDMYVDSQFYVHSIFEDYGLFLDYSDDYKELDDLVNSYNFFNIYYNVYDECLAIESVIHEFLDENKLLQNELSIAELLLNDDYIKDFNRNFSFHMLSDECDSFNYFNDNYINSVYYIDNVSIFDINHKEMVLTKRLFHMDKLIEDIYEDDYTYDLNEDFNDIMDKIDKIIKGRYKQKFPYFVSDKKNDPLSFLKSLNKNVETGNTRTPSGIKQIGILQLLLLNDKLKKDGYLIIDEPEVNLHPDWQFKFAEILVLLAKDLNITIYLNSHSPTFIESIDAFAGFYDMENDVNYYLTEEYGDKYDFTKIDSNELYKLYNNLGNVYDEINKLKLRKRLRNRS